MSLLRQVSGLIGVAVHSYQWEIGIARFYRIPYDCRIASDFRMKGARQNLVPTYIYQTFKFGAVWEQHCGYEN